MVKNAKFFLSLLLIFSILVIHNFGTVFAQEDCESIPSDSANINHKIDCLNNKLGQLGQQAGTLKNQIAQFNAQISLTTLKITETQDKIDLLGGRISTLETSLSDLTNAFSARAVATYKMARGNEPVFLLLSANDVVDALSKFHYLEKVQSADYDLLTRLQSAQDNYKVSKQESEGLQKTLQTQKDALNSQKTAKAQFLAITQSDEIKYQQLLSQAKTQLAAFSGFIDSRGGASLLSNQTFHDAWGYYYNQRDTQWVTLINGRTDCTDSSGRIVPCTVAEFGCLVSSVAMIATHYGHSLNPKDIANTPSVFLSSTAYLLFDDNPPMKGITVNGVKIVRTRLGASTANIDSELAAGRPVIVGLYSGPAHFIVLKSGSNGNYVMNDPFMPNGHDMNFTSKYSVGVITDVETVSVQ